MNIKEPYFTRIFKPLIFIFSILPAIFLAWKFNSHQLGANPIEAITHQTGDWALRFLLISLVISPLRRLLSWSQLIRCRRMLGLFAFFYATLHLITYLWLDQFFWWEGILEDVIKRPFITIGMLAYLLLIPLAITSTKLMIRLLKKSWQTLHKLAYIVPMLAILHYLWLVKSDLREPLIYSLLLIILLAERGIRAYFKTSKKQDS